MAVGNLFVATNSQLARPTHTGIASHRIHDMLPRHPNAADLPIQSDPVVGTARSGTLWPWGECVRLLETAFRQWSRQGTTSTHSLMSSLSRRRYPRLRRFPDDQPRVDARTLLAPRFEWATVRRHRRSSDRNLSKHEVGQGTRAYRPSSQWAEPIKLAPPSGKQFRTP